MAKPPLLLPPWSALCAATGLYMVSDLSAPPLVLQAVVKLPFAEVKSLATAAQQPDPDGQEIEKRDHVSWPALQLLQCTVRVILIAWHVQLRPVNVRCSVLPLGCTVNLGIHCNAAPASVAILRAHSDRAVGMAQLCTTAPPCWQGSVSQSGASTMLVCAAAGVVCCFVHLGTL